MNETSPYSQPTPAEHGWSQAAAQGWSHGQAQPCQDLAQSLREYAREKPEMAALWCLGIGFVLGWKFKPW